MVRVSGFSFRGSAAAIVGRVRHGHPLRDKLSGYKEHDTGFEMHQAMREEGFEIRIVVWKQKRRRKADSKRFEDSDQTCVKLTRNARPPEGRRLWRAGRECSRRRAPNSLAPTPLPQTFLDRSA